MMAVTFGSLRRMMAVSSETAAAISDFSQGHGGLLGKLALVARLS